MFLAGVVGALLVVQPTQLLQDLGVIGITLKHTAIGTLGGFEFLLLLVDVTDLEPYVLFCQRAGRVGDNVLEALLPCQNLI